MRRIMRLLAFLLTVSSVCTEESGNARSNRSTEEPFPAHSMHRLISSVVDQTANFSSTQQFSPGNVSDSVPFLPSGITPSFRNSEIYLGGSTNLTTPEKVNNFTPSYFIGEVIAEPYIPERFQVPKYAGLNSTSRSFNSNLRPSTSLALQHILPYVEQVKQKSKSSKNQGFGEDHQHHQERIPPVHEPSMEDDSFTTPKYMTNYEDQDNHSDRPNRFPYKFSYGHYNMQSTKPISFKDGSGSEKKVHKTRDDQEYQYEHDYRGSAEDFHGSQGVKTNGHSGLSDHEVYRQKHNFNAYGDNYLGFIDPTRDQKSNFEDYLKLHQEHDFVYPTPFYPPESEYPSGGPGYHNDAHYKVYQNKPKSPWHGLLHFAAALIPLGLFVAALQPSVIQVNSSQTMPAKMRSVGGAGIPDWTRLSLPGADDCERRAFCEMAVQGARPGAHPAHTGLWKLANSISEEHAKSVGLTCLVKAVKSNTCSTIKCLALRSFRQRKS